MAPSSGVTVTYERITAAFSVLAADATAQGVQKLLAFCRTVIEEGAHRPTTFSCWLAGTLVIEFRQKAARATLVLIVDDGESFVELFSCDLAFISFDSIERFVFGGAAAMGNVFVLLSEELVSLVAPREIEIEIETGCDDRIAPRPVHCWGTVDDDDDDDDDETLVMPGWDVEVTVVRAPPPDLLTASGFRKATRVSERKAR